MKVNPVFRRQLGQRLLSVADLESIAYLEEPNLNIFDSRGQHSYRALTRLICEGVRDMFEKELSILKEHVRSITRSESSEFKYFLPRNGSIASEAVLLRSCAAQFHKNRVSFCRRDTQGTFVGEEPSILVWVLKLTAKSDISAWYIEDRGSKTTYTTVELAQKILSQLKGYCEEYEDTISFAS
jgi:hypothetical protein